jgi:hypothetical protein
VDGWVHAGIVTWILPSLLMMAYCVNPAFSLSSLFVSWRGDGDVVKWRDDAAVRWWGGIIIAVGPV